LNAFIGVALRDAEPIGAIRERRLQRLEVLAAMRTALDKDVAVERRLDLERESR